MKKIKILLSNRSWLHEIGQSQSRIHSCGTAFMNGAMHRSPREIARPLLEKGAKAMGDALSGLNGFFALVVDDKDRLVAAVDRIRSIPLFYGEKSDAFYISDDAEWVRRRVGDDAMNPVTRDEFQLTGYVTGGETLYPNVRQLQAGELLVIDKTEAEPALATHRYFRFLHVEPGTWDEGVLREQFDACAMASIKRLIDYAHGRQIVIPLSGGYDSRLIATLLAMQGYKNIVTFSYGVKGNKEAAYSRTVADALGLPWHFVEYNNEHWRSAWNTSQRRQYQKWASGWVSLPHVQDWLAVRALQNNETIDRDCVFVPGHTCCRHSTGIPAKSSRDFEAGIDALADSILRKHYSRSVGKSGPSPNLGIWKKRVIDCLEAENAHLSTGYASAHEKWEWQERQSKFIANSVRVYEFFGYDWWLPLWDAEFMDFWRGVPLALRNERRWYIQYIQHKYVSQSGAGEALSNASDIGFLGKSIRSIVSTLPVGVKDYLSAVRYSVLPKRVTNFYIISHLPRSEIKRLEKEGYRVEDSMLLYEFLRMVP